jgi:hypothetical protein
MPACHAKKERKEEIRKGKCRTALGYGDHINYPFNESRNRI